MKINLGDAMTLRGHAALAYARDSWGRDEAKYIGIYPNPVDEEGIFPADMDQVEDVAAEDVGLIYVQISAEEWKRTCDTTADLIRSESVGMD